MLWIKRKKEGDNRRRWGNKNKGGKRCDTPSLDLFSPIINPIIQGRKNAGDGVLRHRLTGLSDFNPATKSFRHDIGSAFTNLPFNLFI